MIIKIGFSRARSPWKIGSLVTQEVEKRSFSHSYFVYNCPLSDELIVSQASHGFVNEVNYRLFLEQNVPCLEYSISVSSEQFKVLFKFIRANLGQKYSYAQLLVIAIKKICGIELVINNNDYICSEWVAKLCSLISIKIPKNMQTITPSDLNECLIKAGFKNELP